MKLKFRDDFFYMEEANSAPKDMKSLHLYNLI